MEVKEFSLKIVPLRLKLIAQARRLAGDDDLAEDLVQEVMLKMWSIRTKLDNHPNHEALAMTILQNRYNDYWRHRKFEASAQNLPENIQEDNKAENRSDIEVIHHIIDHLPPLQAQILKMKEIDGYDKNEILKIIGCSPESLRQNLSRARRRIREEFIRLTK